MVKSENLFIRPVKEDDLDKVMELLALSGHGLTSLPKDREIIHKKILHSLRSFLHRIEERPMGESYLFVMEDKSNQKIVGISGLISKLGGFDPFYVYRVETEERESTDLNIKNKIRSLHLEQIYSGPAEICSLFLSPHYRNSQNGRFLSLSRFLFIANGQQHFEKKIVAEMRGRVDEHGNSPFWEAVGKKFFQIDFPQADYLQVKTKKFIEDLLPTYPLIVDLLPQEAQDVVGQVHPNTVPAKKILEQEGFSYKNQVAILEPGPILEANVADIRTIKKSQLGKVAKIAEVSPSNIPFIVTTTETNGDFLAATGHISIEKNGEIVLPPELANSLNTQVGDQLRYVLLKG